MVRIERIASALTLQSQRSPTTAVGVLDEVGRT